MNPVFVFWCSNGSLPFVESFISKAFWEDINTVSSLFMLVNPHVAFVMISFYYAQQLGYLQHIVFPTHIHSYARPTTRAYLLVFPNTPSFCLSSTHFLTTFRIHLGIPHLMVAHLSWCQCGHIINDLGIHLLHCPCENEHIAAHDTLRNTIAIIVLENGTHIQKRFPTFFPAINGNEWKLSSL